MIQTKTENFQITSLYKNINKISLGEYGLNKNLQKHISTSIFNYLIYNNKNKSNEKRNTFFLEKWKNNITKILDTQRRRSINIVHEYNYNINYTNLKRLSSSFRKSRQFGDSVLSNYSNDYSRKPKNCRFSKFSRGRKERFSFDSVGKTKSKTNLNVRKFNYY